MSERGDDAEQVDLDDPDVSASAENPLQPTPPPLPPSASLAPGDSIRPSYAPGSMRPSYAPQPKKSIPTAVLVGVIMLALVGGGIGVFFVMRRAPQAQADAPTRVFNVPLVEEADDVDAGP